MFASLSASLAHVCHAISDDGILIVCTVRLLQNLVHGGMTELDFWELGKW